MTLSTLEIRDNIKHLAALFCCLASSLFSIMLLILPVAAHAEVALKDIESYLNSIRTLTADFKQYDSDGTVKMGKFWLSKPGKMKWEYTSPRHIAIIANGKTIVYCDYDLEEVSYVSSKSVLAHFLSKEKISFSRDVNVDHYVSGRAYSALTLSEPEGSPKDSNISNLTLKFEHFGTNNKLTEVDVTDGNDQEVEVIFANVAVNTEVDPSVFVFRNPKFFRPTH